MLAPLRVGVYINLSKKLNQPNTLVNTLFNEALKFMCQCAILISVVFVICHPTLSVT